MKKTKTINPELVKEEKLIRAVKIMVQIAIRIAEEKRRSLTS
jgi:hypothetical protein